MARAGLGWAGLNHAGQLLLSAPCIIAGAPSIFLKCQKCPYTFFVFVMGVHEGDS